MKIIVGLGNPGEKYQNTRHNAGFMLADFLADKYGGRWRLEKKFKAEICELNNGLLAKPRTFMNESGQSVRAILDYYKLIPKKFAFLTEKNADLSRILLVIHDDLDIEIGKFKIQENRSAAGHKGVESIIRNLKTKNFTRTRLGVWSPQNERVPGDKFVLQRLPADELNKLSKIFPVSADAIAKNFF